MNILAALEWRKYSMPHLRSPEKRVQRKIWQRVQQYLYKKDITPRQYASRLISDFCFHDLDNKDVVYTEKFEEIVVAQLNLAFEDGWKFMLSYKYGDVLNRFPLKPFPSLNYVGRGALQK